MTIVAGGYDPSLAPEAYEAPSSGVDFVVRGEGELTFRALLRALARGDEPAAIPGLSFRALAGGRIHAHAGAAGEPARGRRTRAAGPRARACSPATPSSAAPSTSSKRRAAAPTTAASARSSRCAGATSTPSISRACSPTSPTRAARGARAIFLVDDNITLNVARFEALVPRDRRGRPQRHPLHRPGDDLVDREPRRDAGAADAEGRIPLRVPRHRERARRGPGVPARVGQERARAKADAASATPRSARSRRCTAPASRVVGGIIVGNPDDTRASIETNLAFARRYVDWPYIQHPTPYPGTPMTRGLPRPRPDRQRARRGVRRHHRGRAHGAPRRPTRSSSCAGAPSAG